MPLEQAAGLFGWDAIEVASFNILWIFMFEISK
jgi:hypothetical protein